MSLPSITEPRLNQAITQIITTVNTEMLEDTGRMVQVFNFLVTLEWQRSSSIKANWHPTDNDVD